MCIVLLVYVVGFSDWTLETRGKLALPDDLAAMIPEKENRAENVPITAATDADTAASFSLTNNVAGV
jgi:hypothetical protein